MVGLMSVCRAISLSLFGIDAVPVEVEVDVGAGLPGFSIVGLPDAAVQEARERVRVAISNSGYKFPSRKVIVNLAPANLRKEGAAFDLPIALAILAVSGSLPAKNLEGAPEDHRASVSVYLHDPDGNDIELYYDRPREEWGSPKAEPFDPRDLLVQSDSTS